MDDKPIERQQYKLLPPSEREYVELSGSKSKKYNPNTILQYNNRIKYRVVNAIKEIAWLCEKLTDDQLKKLFSDDRIEDFFKITEKALEVAAWNPDPQIELILRRTSNNPNQTIISENDIAPRVLLLERHLRELTKHFLPVNQIKEHEKLRNKFFIPGAVSGQLMGLNAHLGQVIQNNELMRVFIEKHGLKETFELEIEQMRKNATISALKSAGVPDDKIEEYL